MASKAWIGLTFQPIPLFGGFLRTPVGSLPLPKLCKNTIVPPKLQGVLKKWYSVYFANFSATKYQIFKSFFSPEN